MIWLFAVACVLWAGVAIGCAVYGYSRGYTKAGREWSVVWNAYDKASSDFCQALLTERNQYKRIAETYAAQYVRDAFVSEINVKGVGKA